MAAELKSVRALREDFVHDFSHEFKTPIASINGFANLLLEGGLTEEDEKKILKIIADESARLSHLAENTLMLSKIENQQFVGESKPFRLDVQIKECIIQLAGEWEKKGIIIDSRLEQITYTGDCNLLRQVWINLLSNAIKFTPELGGKIAVRLYKSSEGIIAKVSDNGVGVAAEDRQKIFEKYYQFGHGGGNGLGLTICKRICQICGGDIRVTSAPGKGTTFIVTL
jgi:signal transduction histidine kinase